MNEVKAKKWWWSVEDTEKFTEQLYYGPDINESDLLPAPIHTSPDVLSSFLSTDDEGYALRIGKWSPASIGVQFIIGIVKILRASKSSN